MSTAPAVSRAGGGDEPAPTPCGPWAWEVVHVVGAALGIRKWCLPRSLLHSNTTPAQVPPSLPPPQTAPSWRGRGASPGRPATIAWRGQVEGTFPAKKSLQDEAGRGQQEGHRLDPGSERRVGKGHGGAFFFGFRRSCWPRHPVVLTPHPPRASARPTAHPAIPLRRSVPHGLHF